MASGPDPPIPDLSESHVAKTVNTSTKVIISSMMKTLHIDTPGPGTGVHKPTAGNTPLRIPAPQTAPADCATTYSRALTSNTHTQFNGECVVILTVTDAIVMPHIFLI